MNEQDQSFTANKIIKHWYDSSEEDFRSMKILFESKSYSWSLFLGHISVEKLLKALYFRIHDNHAPFTHNLYRLAELCNLELNDEKSDWLDKITSFNIAARYDDYKKEFLSKCTEDFSKEWITKISEIRDWIKKKF